MDKLKPAKAVDSREAEAIARARAMDAEWRRRAAFPLWRTAISSLVDTFGALAIVLLPFYVLYHLVNDVLWLVSLLQ